MTVRETSLSGVLVIEPRRFEDDRGAFTETYNADRYAAAGITTTFVQDNLSVSRQGVLRGLHFQNPHPQAKLVTVLIGEVFDVVVDIRAGSPTFGRWIAERLSGENGRQMFVPEGFAHGFVALTEIAHFSYKCSDVYHPGAEGSIRWNDPELAIEWPTADPILSPKDAVAPFLRDLKILPPN